MGLGGEGPSQRLVAQLCIGFEVLGFEILEVRGSRGSMVRGFDGSVVVRRLSRATPRPTQTVDLLTLEPEAASGRTRL
jgi:hypothetical protein